ncbi:MAG: hypothetical protein DWI21_15330 [Planctomycetota bacterium]|nr:MAG: hypothetical protein DWI21_15330 [Planctomycetota bacterium]GDY08076.1 hypothetical protein LBMAG52_15620 [Planctomycetia bacterium]
MALWQFDIQLMPDPVVADATARISAAITDDGLDTTGWWLPNALPADYKEIIAAEFPPLFFLVRRYAALGK